MKNYLFLFASLFVLTPCYPQQNNSFYSDFIFVQYLIDRTDYDDAIFVLKQHPFGESSSFQADSLNYLLGLCHYCKKSLDSSAVYFSKVNRSSLFFARSLFYKAFILIYRNNYMEARHVLAAIPKEDNEPYIQLCFLFNAGMALLEKDTMTFTSFTAWFNRNSYQLKDEMEDMDEQMKQLQNIRLRSPLFAGMLSALFPGSGKFLLGQKGRGIADLVMVSMLGAVLTENILKAGWNAPTTWVSGGLFSLFYIGNIWGTVLAAKINPVQQFEIIQKNTLANLDSGLHHIFE